MNSASTKKNLTSGFMLEKTAKKLKQYFQRQLQKAEAGITIDQWVILQQLDQKNGLSQLEIGQGTFKDAPTVTRIIDLLCQKKLIRRVKDPSDRRRFKIQLTSAGRRKIEEVIPVIRRARSQAWEGLGDEDIDRLAHTLNLIFENLE